MIRWPAVPEPWPIPDDRQSCIDAWGIGWAATILQTGWQPPRV